MIGLLGAHILALAACTALVWLPGWAIARLLQLQLYVPALLSPVAWFAFGLSVWTIAFGVTLALGQPIAVTLAVHGAVTLALLLGVWRRTATHGHAKRPEAAISTWTVAAIALSVLLAAVLRTRIAFDTLFHIGLTRRILELPSPGFDSLDRIAGSGVNPAYSLPSWQALLAGASAITGLDPATLMEATAVLAVLLAACAAGALGRVVTGTVAGELAGAAAFGWLRVFYPRRELEGDGVAYAALAGNISIDIMLVLALVVAVLIVQRAGEPGGALALAALGSCAMVLLVVLHANYVVYLAIIGVGTVGWLVATGPWTADIRRGLLRALAALALPGVIAMGAILPLLATLDHFGAPLEQRIDYHLVGSGAWRITRPGHLYDWFAAPGLFAMLLLPWAAWRARGVGRALIAGGMAALMAAALLPPLLQLLGASGSLTLGLRLPRPIGVLLAAALAVALPDLIARVSAVAAAVRARRGRVAGWAVVAAPLIVVAGVSAAYGYPLSRQDPPEYGWNWPTLVGAAGLLVALGLGIRHRAAGSASGQVAPGGIADDRRGVRVVGLGLLAVAVALLPSGFDSLRRGAWQSRQLVSAVRADDLGCVRGIQRALEALPPGDTVLADPMTAYQVQAVSPVYIVADFKTWNGSTDTSRSARRIESLDQAFASDSADRAAAAVEDLVEEFDARWVVVARGEVKAPVGAEVGDFDAAGLREALDDGTLAARRVAAGTGEVPGRERTSTSRAACDLELWELRSTDAPTNGTREEAP